MTKPDCQNSAFRASLKPFQFSLRTLFVIVTLASLFSAGAAALKMAAEWCASVMHQMDQEQRAIVELQRLGGIVDHSENGTLVQLGGTKITDADLVILKEVYSARYISLYDTAITDAGLVHLQSLPILQQLDLTHTQVTPEGVARLRKSLPGVAVYLEPK